ncbi:Hpt domain-containing protein [Legionella sp. CNM-4043-24]|uniref:Hpt domain-containing protein n=1 Tax=Legionella sp. CNM-4043-24 TaxID=3421646 RepID=UPI00403AF076
MTDVNEYGQLGRDLPDTEEQLFQLEKYPLLDADLGIQTMGSRSLFKSMLNVMVTMALPDDLSQIKKAYADKDWDLVENLAHKIKSGAMYCGTIKMQYACQYLERYRKAGYSQSLDRLYHQLLDVLEETQISLTRWLSTAG